MFFFILCIYIFIDIFIYKTHSYDIPNVVSFSNATLIYSNMFFFSFAKMRMHEIIKANSCTISF